MKQYEKYKPTKISWIGEVPSHWRETKLKYIGYLYSGLTGKGGDDFKQLGNTQNKPFIPFTNIANNERISPKQLEEVLITDNDHQNKVEKGDLFFMMSSENFDDVGKSTILLDDLGEVYLNSFCKGYRITDKNVNPLYLNYLLLNYPYRRRLMIEANGFTRINLKMEKVNDFEITLPPKDEQTVIANFLEKKTTDIDKLIYNKQKLIELLKEEKTAIINNAVTKGINSNVKLKPTNNIWIGDIPEHWEIVKCNHYIRLRHGYQFMNYDFTPEGIKVVKITQLNPDGTLDLSSATFIDESRLQEFQDILINVGDILMALTGGTIGKIIRVTEVNEPLLQNYRVGNFFPANMHMDKDFMFWILSSEIILNQIFFEQRETGQPNIGKENFNSMHIALPPLEEQIKIAKALKTGTEKIKETISKIETEILLMKEYRAALISEAVTGKIKLTT